MKYFFVVIALALATSTVNATVLYNDRTTFEGTLGSSIVDDYENPGYNFINTNAEMTAVLGETAYTTTGFDNYNLVTGNGNYCAGCNGSYLLDFTNTSVSGTNGVFGVGLDYYYYGNSDTYLPYYAYVTFGDGTTSNYELDFTATDLFFGITSELLIASIHIGLIDGGATTSGGMEMDNLTIGNDLNNASVPAPASVLLLGLGLLGLAANRKKV